MYFITHSLCAVNFSIQNIIFGPTKEGHNRRIITSRSLSKMTQDFFLLNAQVRSVWNVFTEPVYENMYFKEIFHREGFSLRRNLLTLTECISSKKLYLDTGFFRSKRYWFTEYAYKFLDQFAQPKPSNRRFILGGDPSHMEMTFWNLWFFTVLHIHW